MHRLSRRTATRLVLVAAFSLVASMPPVAAETRAAGNQGLRSGRLFRFGKPIRGLPEIEYEWDEHRYRFARAEHRELFKADPVRYAPQFANFCAMALTRGEIVEANPEYWLISEGKLYLFGRRAGRACSSRPSRGT